MLRFVFLSAALLPIAGVESLRNADAVVASVAHNKHRHRRRQRAVYDDGRTNDASRKARASLNEVGRGGGGGRGGDDDDVASSSPRASKRLLRSIRLLYFTYYASLGALMPYLPVYFHSLGHPGSAVGLLGAVKPLTTFLVAPLWGVLSDRSNDHVATLQFTFLSSLLFQVLVGTGSGSVNYLIATVFAAAALNAPVKSLIDSLVMGKLTSEEDRHQFGRLRLWGQVGFGVGSSLVGSLLSAFPGVDPAVDGTTRSTPSSASTIMPATSSDPTFEKVVHNIEVGIEVASESAADAETAALFDGKAFAAFLDMTRDLLGKTPRPLRGYEWAFVTHAVLAVPAFFCIRSFRTRKGDDVMLEGTKGGKEGSGEAEEKKHTDIGEGLRLLAKNRDALVFFFLAFVIGTSSGCIENFAYVRVREVGGTGSDMGILRLICSLAGAPMFWFSGPVTELLGTDGVLVLSLVAYALRFFNYAMMRNPYHALPAEILRGVTFAAFWSAGSMYAHRISPPGMNATMLLIMNAMYGGLGQSLGAIIGGRMQTRWGTARTFVYSGVFDVCFVGALVAYLASGKKRAFCTPSTHP